MVNTSCIAEFSVVAEPPSRTGELPPVPAANGDLCKTRETRAVEKAKAEGVKVCVQATAFGQSLFNELNKTMPCDSTPFMFLAFKFPTRMTFFPTKSKGFS